MISVFYLKCNPRYAMEQNENFCVCRWFSGLYRATQLNIVENDRFFR